MYAVFYILCHAVSSHVIMSIPALANNNQRRTQMIRKFLCKMHHEYFSILRSRILLTIAAFLAGLARASELPETVWAAEQAKTKPDILTMELGVSQGADGIFAYCIYQEFDESNGTMQLYLERMNEQGQFLPVSYADLDPAGMEPRIIRTTPEKPVPGIYKAVLLVRGNAGTPVVRFQNSAPYEVKMAEEYLNGEGFQDEPADQETTSLCEHILTENILREADPAHDAVSAECCQKCGHVFSCFEIPNSAYSAFLRQSAEKIRNAPLNGLLIIETDRWVSFNKDVLDAMAARRDLSILIKYRFKGREQQTFVPPEADVSGFADENGFCGFCRMADLLRC